jgi:hypothetical protein
MRMFSILGSVVVRECCTVTGQFHEQRWCLIVEMVECFVVHLATGAEDIHQVVSRMWRPEPGTCIASERDVVPAWQEMRVDLEPELRGNLRKGNGLTGRTVSH